MFRLYSKGCEYAIRALVLAVMHGGNGRFLAKDVCEQADIPESFTRKIFQALVQGRFLEAVRGPGGGYVLTKDPSEISILEVIHAVDGEETFQPCVMGLPECGSENACPLHHVWAQAKESLLERLSSTTLQDLVDVASRPPGANGEKSKTVTSTRPRPRAKRKS